MSELSAAAPAVGMTVTIKGLSNKGKNVVKRDGATWQITRIEPRVLFSAEAGPWLFLSCGVESASRWVHASNDSNFSVALTTEA